MIRILPAVLEVALLVFGLIDCVMADQARIRNLPRWAWILLIVIVPFVGVIAWLLAGRPQRAARRTPPVPPGPTPSGPTWERPPYLRPAAPDDDPEFIARLKRTNADHERMMKRWEEDLRRREEELRDQAEPDDSGPPAEDR